MDNLFTPSSIPSFDYDRDLGQSGQPPYTRGIYPNMYQGREFTMRQLTGIGTPKDTNERIRFMLDNGATGLSVLFDFPTIEMYDSDDPLSIGHIGTCGVCVDTVEDMHILFDGINLEKHSISLVTHYPSNTAILFSMFLSMAEEKGFNISKLRGSVQNDITMEEVIRCGSDFIPPDSCFRIQCDNIEYIRNNLPNWTPVTLNGYNLRDAGSTDVMEMAAALANGLETIKELQLRGYDPSFISSRIAFFWSIGNNFFNEVSRLRAVRKLWCNLLVENFSISDPKALKLKCHVQTSGMTLTRQEPYNNIIRASYQALAAILGGVQSLHVDSYDEAYSVPTEESALMSLRTQQILQVETGITDIIDPIGGSYYIEHKTLEYERMIREELNNIDDLGGYVNLIKSGELHKELLENSYKYQKDVDGGRYEIVGLNKYVSPEPPHSISGITYPEDMENIQKNFLNKVKNTRNSDGVSESLEDLKSACEIGSNILSSCISCACNRCTKSEMFKVFKDSFGLWTKPCI